MALVFRSMASIPLGLGLLSSFLNILVSRTGLHKKFNERTVCFFKNCLSSIMLKRLAEDDVLKTEIFDNFSAVLIIDSSSWDIPDNLKWIFPGSGGGASEANCKLQLCYDYRTGEPLLIEETKGILADQKYGRCLPSIVNKNALIIFDLGYWAFATFLDIVLKRAFILCRFNTQVQLWGKTEDTFFKITLYEWLNKQYSYAVETEAFLRRDDNSIPIRLVAWKAPEEVANVRKMKLRKNAKKKGYTVSAGALAFCEWSIFITNANSSMIPGKMIRSCYRVRWNVELIFKSWKSILSIHRTNVRNNLHRLRCELYAKLILAVIVHNLYKHIHLHMWKLERRELSLDKLWKYINSNKQKLHEKAREDFFRFIDHINSELDYIKIVCEKYHQNSRNTTLQRIDKMNGDIIPVKVVLKPLEDNCCLS